MDFKPDGRFLAILREYRVGLAAISGASFAAILEIFGRNHHSSSGPTQVSWALAMFVLSCPFALIAYIQAGEFELFEQIPHWSTLVVAVVALVSFILGSALIVESMWPWPWSVLFMCCVAGILMWFLERPPTAKRGE